jgi:hypothetical protein
MDLNIPDANTDNQAKLFVTVFVFLPAGNQTKPSGVIRKSIKPRIHYTGLFHIFAYKDAISP